MRCLAFRKLGKHSRFDSTASYFSCASLSHSASRIYLALSLRLAFTISVPPLSFCPRAFSLYRSLSASASCPTSFPRRSACIQLHPSLSSISVFFHSTRSSLARLLSPSIVHSHYPSVPLRAYLLLAFRIVLASFTFFRPLVPALFSYSSASSPAPPTRIRFPLRFSRGESDGKSLTWVQSGGQP